MQKEFEQLKTAFEQIENGTKPVPDGLIIEFHASIIFVKFADKLNAGNLYFYAWSCKENSNIVIQLLHLLLC